MSCYYYIPSKFAQENLIVSNQMGEFYLKDFIIDRASFPNHLFMYIKSGTFHVEQFGKHLILKSGDCIFMTLHDKHLYYSDKDDVADFFWMHFRGNIIEPLIDKLAVNKSLPIVVNDHNLGRDLLNCQKIALENEDNFEYTLSAKIYEIFMKITAEALAEIELKSSENNPDFIKVALDYIDQHIYNKISLPELAERVHMDKFYFIQQFYKYVNTTPIKYISQKKLQLATKLLKKSDMPINEIAQNLGFFDQSHFNKTFKEKMGISPSNYRKTIAKKNKDF